MSDFTVSVDFDASAILRGFAKLEQDAKAAGASAGKGLAEGLQGFSSKSITALQQELQRLTQRQLKVDVDSRAFTVTGERIRAVQAQLDSIQRKQVAIGVDDRSITALQSKLQALQARQVRVDVDSSEFVDLQRQINAVERELADVERKRIRIDVDTNSITAITSRLQSDLDRLQQRQLRIDVDSQEFRDLGREIDRIQDELAQVERNRVTVGVDDRSIVALQSKLQALQARQVKVDVDSSEFLDLQREIDKTQADIAEVERKRILISVEAGSITALQARLQDLQTRQTKVSVDSTEFARLEREIDGVNSRISDVSKRRLLINADPSSIVALRARVSELQGELENVKIGSQRFRELQGEIRKAQGELSKAEQGSRSLGSALQAVQSIPFLAGFASAAGLIGLLKGAIDQAVQLEVITRKLSNSLGQQGAAGALSFTRGLADELGLSFKTLAGTFGSFTAAATSAGVPLQVQKDLFAAVSKAAQSLGLSNDELSGSLLALQQVASKGTVQMEELRGQLGERLPIAFAAAARGLGLTQQELIKLVESGKLTADRFFPALTKGLNELTAGSGGVATAAQNFQKLGNAWDELQTTFGQNLLPGVTEAVKALTGALEGIRVESAAKELRQSFGVTTQEAYQLVGALGEIQKQYGLTWQQSKNLLSTAIANTGASRDWFGELNLGGQNFNQVQLNLIDLAKRFRDINPDLVAQKNAEAIAANKVAQEALKTLEIEKQRKINADALAQVQGQAQVQALSNQITVGQSLLSLAQAIGQAEQSRFAVTRSALDFELQQAEKRGASEQQIGAIKKQIEANDKAALQARFQALQTEQALQRTMLALTQEKARTEANLEVSKARVDLQKLEVELAKAATDQEKEKLRGAIEQQKVVIGMQEGKLSLLQQTQPLEAAALGFQQEAARNGLQAEAAAKGYRFALDGTLQPANKLAELQGRVGTITKASAEDQRRYGQLAEQSGLAIGRAADGTLVLGRTQKDVNTAVDEMNRKLSGAKGGYDAASRGAANTTSETDKLRRALFDANLRADEMAAGIGDAGNKAKGAKGETDKLGRSLEGSANPAGAVAEAFLKVGNRAPAAVQGARDFAGWLSQAKVFAENIRDIRLEDRMAGVRDRTREAARAAGEFFRELERASKLPGSRWTGGPVEAGGEYKINELGQEAFLSAGRLSLINAPANSVWRAPSDGVVIPAGMTAQLQARAAVEASGGNPGVAELAIEVGKLRAEVGNLARRDWSVHVQHRTGPTGSQVMRTLLS